MTWTLAEAILARMEPRARTFDPWWVTLAESAENRVPGETFRPDDTFDAPPAIPSNGSGVSDLSVQAVLGTGGMGVVHLAIQRSLDREVAVKQAHNDDPRAAGFLLREARIMGRLEHPNVVPVHSLDYSDDGRPALVMKRVQGVSWRALLDDPDHPFWKRRLPLSGDSLAQHVHILLDVCNALSFAHSRGVVHRDLKPDNVMVGEFGEVYLMDWGIAAEIGESVPQRQGLVGTPAYLPPELLHRPYEVSTALDIYLLGACLHELLVGAPRHVGADLTEVLQAASTSAPYAYPPHIPLPLAELCNRACAPDPADRPATVDDFRDALTGWLRWSGAQQLLDTAKARISQLEQLIRSASPDPAEVQRLYTTCRAVLKDLQISRDSDPEVLRLTLRVLERKAYFDLAHGDLVAAAASVQEINDLGGDAQELEDHLSRYRKQAERLRKLSRELDYSVSEGPRKLVVIAATVVLLAQVGFSIGRRITGQTDHIIMGYPLVLVIAATILIPLLWPWLRRNRVNRQAAGAILVMTWSWLLQRGVQRLADVDPDAIMLADLALFSCWMAMLGVFIRPWLAVPVPILVLGALIMNYVEDMHGVFLITTLAAVLSWFGAWAWVRRSQAKPS